MKSREREAAVIVPKLCKNNFQMNWLLSVRHFLLNFLALLKAIGWWLSHLHMAFVLHRRTKPYHPVVMKTCVNKTTFDEQTQLITIVGHMPSLQRSHNSSQSHWSIAFRHRVDNQQLCKVDMIPLWKVTTACHRRMPFTYLNIATCWHETTHCCSRTMRNTAKFLQ